MSDKTMKILVVDDETVTTDLAKAFLEKNGFAVVIAEDGQEAIRVAEQEMPDLILLDVMLPSIDGFEVCRRLKGGKFANIPILMFTARGFSSDIERGREVGADEYIVKPFSGRALVATIKKHLGMSE
ncbi:MAG: response regulator transcription factor [Candidatus Thorarchaeota archaeon]